MPVDNKIQTLYNTLKQGGANVGKDAEEFSNWFLQPGDTGYQRRHEVWQTLSDGGAQVGQNYEQFRDWLNLGSSPSQVNKPSREERIKAIVGLNDMVGKSKDYVNSAKKRVNDILKTTQKPLNRGSVDIALGDDGAPQIGHNTNVRVKQGFNAQTGKAENQYTTESGNTYDSSAVANVEQNTIDDIERYKLDPVKAELEDAYAERDNLNALMAEIGKEEDKQNNSGWKGILRGLASSSNATGGVFNNEDTLKKRDLNPEYQKLHAAAIATDKRIKALEAVRDRTTKSLFKSTIASVTDPTKWDDGYSNAMKGIAKLDAINNNKNKTTEQQELSQRVLKSLFNNQQAEAIKQEDMNAWGRFGDIAGSSVPFMKDFFLAGGAESFGRMGAEGMTNLLAKTGISGIKKTLLKNTGIGVSELFGANMMANVMQGGTTFDNIADRQLGQVQKGDDGTFNFTGGEGFMTSLYKGQLAQTFENYTEMLGAHMGGALLKKGATKVLDKVGLNAVSSFFAKVGSTPFYKEANNLLKMGGINGYFGEVGEEEANIVLNSVFVRDNKLSDLVDKRTQEDILGGMLFSVGAMHALPAGAGIGFYYNAKHGVTKADKIASTIFTPEKWGELKEKIDGTSNDKLTDVILDITSDDEFSTEEKKAALSYIKKATVLRGYNTASVANELNRGEETQDDIINNASDAYHAGQNATDEQKAEIKRRYDTAIQALEGIDTPENIDKWIDNASDSRGINIYLSREGMTEEQKQSVLEYVNSKAAFDGMIDATQNNIDDEVAVNNTLIDTHTHADGNIHPVTLNAKDDTGLGKQAYLIGGNVAFNEDGTIDTENSNESVIIRHADTGELEMVSPKAIQSGGEVIDAEEEKATSSEVIRQQKAQEQSNIIDDILPFNPNDTYTIIGEDGAQHQVQIIDADNTMAQVSIDGASPTVVNKADIQSSYEMTKRVASAEIAPTTNNTTSDVEQHANNASSSENVQEGNDELIDRARGGDLDAIAQLDEYQIPYKNKNVYRHVGQEEVDKLLNGEEIKSRRVARLIDVTSSSEPTTGASSDYRVTFNDSHDFDKHKGGVRMKNEELGDGFLENGSYSLNDVATIEKRNEDGTYTIVYSAKGSAETTPSEKNTEQPTDTRERDADNNLIYHKLPVEETIADLYDGSLDDNEVNAFVQANIKESEKNLKEITKRAPKITSNKAKYLADKQAWQQKLDEAKQIAEYWKAVESERRKITHTTQQELEAVQDELSGKNALEQLNGSAQSKEQFVEAFVRSAKFNPEDVMRESGMKVGDIKGMLAILRQDGMSIQEAAEELALKDEQENGGMYFGGDDTEARNAIIDGILSYGGNAKEKASTEEQRMIEDYIQELDVTFLDAYGLTFKEYLQYSEVELPELLRKYTTFDDILYINEHYEEIDNELTRLENENRRAYTTAENGSDANSTEVLQETQPNDGEGTGDSNEQGSEVETGLQGNNEHEPVSEETSRSDVEPFTPNAKKEGEGIFDFADRVVDETKRKEEEEKVETNPTEKQKEAGNYKKGHINVDGFDVTIEQPKGSVRRGTDANGEEWETTMHNTYGYIRGTEGVDGDHIDIFLSDDPTEGKVFVVDQTNEDGTFDEHKVMYGFVNEEEARKAYLSNYSDGWQGLGNITEVSKEDFKKWIDSSKRKTKPFAEYSIAKTEAPLEEVKQETEQNGTEKPSSTTKEEKSTDTKVVENKAVESEETPIQQEKKVEKNATQPTQEQQAIGNELVDRIQASGIKVHIIGEEIEKVLKDTEGSSEIFKSNNGVIYGFVKDGEIYLDPTLIDANSPVHEYTHLWDAVVQKNNPELWKRGKELMKKLSIWQEVLNDENYADIKDNEDLVASEVHSRLAGEESEKIFQNAIDSSKGVIKKAEAYTLVEQVKQWLNNVWNAIKDTFTSWTREEADKVSLDEFVNMPLKDLLNGKSFKGVNIKSEEQTIVDDAKKTGTYLKAPNGNDSNLNEKQWVQVRTRAFKEWFGDWENDKENASKVVDENGEPLVVYHGTDNKFTEFNPSYTGRLDQGYFGKGFYFTPDKSMAKGYAKGAHGDTIMEVFINLRNPLNTDMNNTSLLGSSLEGYDGAMVTLGEDKLGLDEGDRNSDELMEIIVKNSNQIKSAIDNSGTFDSNNPDIRYMKVKGKDGEKSLVGIHNISEEKLAKAINQGGLANPSAAVVNLDNGEHSGFGSISLIMPSSLVDKSKGKNSGTYTGDAWTPIYPNIEYYETKESKKKEEELFSFLDDDTRKYAITALHYANDGITNRRGNPLAVAFLHEKGIDVEVAKDNYNAGLEANNYINKNGLEAEYNTWVGNTLSGLGYDEKFEVGWSSSGKRILKKNTLENVSNWMKKQAKQRIGETSFPTDWILEQMAKLISLKQIQQRREELTSLEEVEDFRINLKEKIDKIAKEIGAWNAIDELKKKNRYINPFIEYDTLMYDVFSGITKGKSYEELNKYWGTNITEEVSDEIKQLSKDVAHAPRKYFETKFERPVYLNEFAAAVVPDNIDPELENSLKASGLDIFKYNMKDESSRTEAVRKATESRDDILFSEGKSEEDLPEPKFNAKEMQSHVDELTKKLNLDNVVVLTSTEGLDEKKAKSKGWYDKNTGKITIVIPNNADLADVEKTLLHEAVAHYGLRKLFGNRFDVFLDKVYSLGVEDVKEAIDKLAREKYKGNIRLATEEYMASLAEDTNFEDAKDKGFWQKIKDAFISVLRKLGLVKPEAIGDNELRYTLWRSYKNLAENDKKSLLNMAEDIAKQYQLKVGEYEENNLYRDGEEGDINITEKERAEVREVYNKKMAKGITQAIEAMQDSMKSLFVGMLSIWHSSGNKGYIEDIPGFENAYLGENRLSSVNQDEVAVVARNLFVPLHKSIAKLTKGGRDYKDLITYMMCKHGLERNAVMAQKDAEEAFEAYKLEHPNTKKTIGDFLEKATSKDYSGITALMEIEDVVEAEQRAIATIASYEKSHYTDDLWDRIRDITSYTLKKSFDSGILSKEQYDKISSMYQYYIPLRGFNETTSSEAYAYLNDKGNTFNAPVKAARGRKSVADDPIAYLRSIMESTIMQANRNTLVKQRFLYFAQNHPSDLVSVNDLWLRYDDITEEWTPVYPELSDADSKEAFEEKMQAFEEKMQILAEENPEKYKHGKDAVNIPYKVVTSNDLHQHQVIAKVGGKDYVITINGNPRMAQALNGMTNPDNDLTGSIGKIISITGDINRTLSGLYTTLQPDFIASNFVRDTIFSNTMVWVKESPGYAARYNATYVTLNPRSMKILFAKYRKDTLDMSNERERLFKEFLQNGGETGYARLFDVDRHKKEIQKAIDNLNERVPLQMVRKAMAEWIGEIGRGVESQARFCAYITSRQMGRTIDRSIWDAKEISVNFNKKGAGSKFYHENGQTFWGNRAAFWSDLGRTNYLFWNAAIQGTFGNYLKYAKRHPAKALIGTAAIFYALGLLLPALGASGGDGGDDDKDNSYFNFSSYIRRSNIMIPILGTKSWFKIPLPIEYRSIYGLGEMLGSTLFNGEELDTKEFLGQVSQVLPVDVMQGQKDGEFSFWKPLVASSIKPIVEVMINEGWNGLPIYKNTPFNKDMPEWTKGYKNTNTLLLEGTKALNDATGGDEYKKGFIDLNPARIEYLFRGYGGGFWTVPDQLIKSTEVAAGNRDFDWKYIPLFNRVVANNDDQTQGKSLNNEYFRYKEEYDEIERLLNNYRRDTETGKKDYSKEIENIESSPAYTHFMIFNEYKGVIEYNTSALKYITDEDEKKRVEDEIYQAKRDLVKEIKEYDDSVNKK